MAATEKELMNRPAPARLELQSDPTKSAALSTRQPLTIGRADGNLLRLASLPGVSDHHAVVRWTRPNNWVVCDWKSIDGTYLEGRKIRQCKPLNDGDEIRLGNNGPVLVFRLHQPVGTKRAKKQTPAVKKILDFAGTKIELQEVKAAHVHSYSRYQAVFSWWVLLTLGGLVLLPVPWLFAVVESSALAGWIYFGSRKEHVLTVTMNNGMAYRHFFSSKTAALAHRNGIRKAIGPVSSS